MAKVEKNLIKLKKDMMDLIKLFSNIEQINFNYVSATNNIIMLLLENENIHKGNFEEKLSDADIEYIKEIFSGECFTFKEMNNYIKKLNINEEEEKNKLINSCLWVSAYLSLNYIGNAIDYIDLVQQGSIGIDSAINKYRNNNAKAFSTLVKAEIISSLIKYVREFGKYGQIINKEFNLISSLDYCKDLFLNNNGYDGNLYDIADYLNYPVDSLEQLMLISSDFVDIDEIDDESIFERMESSVVDVEEEAIKNYDYTDIIEACNLCLNDREKYVIYHYFGINNCRCMNYFEIGEHLGCSSERIRQIFSRALYKVRMKYKVILNKRRRLLSIDDVKELRMKKITI